MRVLLLLLIPLVLWGQEINPDDDVFQAELAAAETGFIAEMGRRFPGATVEKMSRDGIVYKTVGGKPVSVHGRELGYSDQDTGEWKVRDARLWRTSKGWAMRGTHARVRIVNDKKNKESTVGVFFKDGTSWSGFGLVLPAVRHNSGMVFNFGPPANTWRLDVRPSGFEITGPPTHSAKGTQSYSFQLVTSGITPRVLRGDILLEGSDRYLSAPVMHGADSVHYACGDGWSIGAGSASFVCDDSSLPAEAYPYRIDPTYTATSTGDGDMTMDCTTPYSAGCGSASLISQSATTGTARGKKLSGTYSMDQYAFRIDTTSDPTYTPLTATVYLYVTAYACPTGSNAVLQIGVKNFISPWGVSASSYTTYPPNNGDSVASCGSPTASAWNNWPLDATGVDDIENAANTYFIMSFGNYWAYGASDNNYVTFNTVESANDPYVIVTWTIPGGTMLLNVNTD